MAPKWVGGRGAIRSGIRSGGLEEAGEGRGGRLLPGEGRQETASLLTPCAHRGSPTSGTEESPKPGSTPSSSFF
ncbi:UNVERIFIED_CONTAM: hypothetical protein K2H54_041875 [Gekko kuhli]